MAEKCHKRGKRGEVPKKKHKSATYKKNLPHQGGKERADRKRGAPIAMSMCLCSARTKKEVSMLTQTSWTPNREETHNRNKENTRKRGKGGVRKKRAASVRVSVSERSPAIRERCKEGWVSLRKSRPLSHVQRAERREQLPPNEKGREKPDTRCAGSCTFFWEKNKKRKTAREGP